MQYSILGCVYTRTVRPGTSLITNESFGTVTDPSDDDNEEAKEKGKKRNVCISFLLLVFFSNILTARKKN